VHRSRSPRHARRQDLVRRRTRGGWRAPLPLRWRGRGADRPRRPRFGRRRGTLVQRRGARHGGRLTPDRRAGWDDARSRARALVPRLDLAAARGKTRAGRRKRRRDPSLANRGARAVNEWAPSFAHVGRIEECNPMATNLGTGGKIRREDALEYHATGRPGKLEIAPTKPVTTARDLSLAYSPGVAEPCREIAKDADLSYRYTARGNLVACISNGTAVLGLGDIGPYAAKPVMEGKGVLFKKFADIDVFDIEIDARDVDEMVRIIQSLEPTFGGINLEDIRAPECFELEERLKACMNIPVFHDDQHGTAIISGAALLNAAELAGKKLEDLKVVVSGAGASAIACARFYIALGVRRQNIVMVDSKGVIYEGRTEGMNPYKAQFAVPTDKRTLEEAMVGADVFLGLSAAGLVTQDMVRSMADRPIVFALANPDPEISYPDAIAARPDVIMATGRSDYPNQVNNVLGFPYIFRGALDVRARAITENMKLAAAHALARLAREDVPEHVMRAYGGKKLSFGPEYIIPTPFDDRVLWWVA